MTQSDGLGLARQMARERDQRFEQLKTAEAERDRYARALLRIIETWEGGPHPRGPQMLVAIAKDALRR